MAKKIPLVAIEKTISICCFYPSRIGRNPKTAGQVETLLQYVPHCKAGKISEIE